MAQEAGPASTDTVQGLTDPGVILLLDDVAAHNRAHSTTLLLLLK